VQQVKTGHRDEMEQPKGSGASYQVSITTGKDGILKWKQGGRPNAPHSLVVNKRQAK